MCADKNLILNDSDDGEHFYNSSSNAKHSYSQSSKQNPIISRNFTSSGLNNQPSTLKFLRGNSNYDETKQTKYEQEENNNAKPNYLEKIKTMNAMNSAQNANKMPSTLLYSKKAETFEQNQHEDGPITKTFETSTTGFNPMKRPDSSGGMNRPGSSQSQSNLVRQQFLEQQKQKLKEKQNALMQTKSITMNKTATMNNPSFFNDNKKSSEDINYANLEKVVKKEDREQHEPGTNRKAFNLPTLSKVDHMISFNMQNNGAREEKIEEYNLEDNPTTRKEDAGFLDKGNKQVIETKRQPSFKEENAMNDVEMQRKSQILNAKQDSPKMKAVKFHDEEDDDIDPETLNIAKQIKKNLKEGKGEIKITLKEEETKKNEKEEKMKSNKAKEGNVHRDEENNDSEDEANHHEEEKIQPNLGKTKTISEKNTDLKVFKNFDSISDIKDFIVNPAPEGYIIQCVIRRERTGWARLYPKYKVFFSNKGTFLLAGKKRSHNKTSNYLISVNPDDFKKNSHNVVGKVRSNFMGTEFHVYDTGSNPKKNGATMENVRKELAVVTYETNFFGSKGPRKMKALIPDIRDGGDGFYQWKPTRAEDGMLQYFKSGKREGLRHLFNKPPKWNEHIGAFVLNFNGRVDKPSVKNFQLIDEYDDSHVYLQFGRTGNEEFTMDYSWPLTGVQAFGICISSFDYKIACE